MSVFAVFSVVDLRGTECNLIELKEYVDLSNWWTVQQNVLDSANRSLIFYSTIMCCMKKKQMFRIGQRSLTAWERRRESCIKPCYLMTVDLISATMQHSVRI